ncbi:putative alpha-ketoglutarate-dependent 2,4-dichlorophenoxyacetate dioxygenase [Neohortaea acidophila]|uniref:Putative alpha-ketoglutarate-dependent 2,4-dichlorophenoxyacetate dioxygenase n=1 Tax=Neohortaea acidophila TaxID=245834 RepID=A0A6A6PV25_9PEZI|nr:putative alpha-ketoglutarate-dependent 2,4-dichlorophenoxyacetate dioxygenase [Neohortaea acidophila]KAF2483097.1 putative alpha-ketoglutarate-dependent 2,4-dichlorophenoxyacetate dioxygenase [Neohortaea acidophila]
MAPSKLETTQLSARPLHDTFGAEVEGVDWSESPISAGIIAEIKALASENGVLVFRNANLDNDQHIAFARQLGKELYDVKAHIKAGRAMRFPEQPEIFDVSNLDDKGNIVTDMDPMRKEGNKGNFLWHADMTYNPHRALYSILRAVQLPPKGTGGETQYLDSRTACEELPPALRAELEEALGCKLEQVVTHNSLMHNRKLGSPDYFRSIEPLDQPMAKYKLVTPHEKSNRDNLYMTSYAHHFDGKSWEESKPLFDKLWDHLTQDKYILTVYWENDGDMVLWDNTAVLHRATDSGSYGSKYVRDMRRTTTKDDSSYAFGENEDHTWEAGISKVKT